MPIYYDLVRRPDPDKTDLPQPLYPRVVHKGTAEKKELLTDMGAKVDEATLSRVLIALRHAVCRELMRSNRVHLEGWGSFTLRLEGGPVEDPEDIHAQSIQVAGINFRPDKAFVNACREGDIKRDSNGFTASADCDLDAQLRVLADHFAEHREMTTRTFACRTGLVGKKAYNALANLVEKGYLLRLGKRAATHYIRTDKPLE